MMTVPELCEILRLFQANTDSIRGRKVNEGAIVISLDSDGSGQIRAHLEMPGHGTPDGIIAEIVADDRGMPDRINADFTSLTELESILRGEIEPDWTFDDEDTGR